MAVVAPIPRASVRMAVRLKAGSRRNMRNAYRTSCQTFRRPCPAGAPGVMAAGACACRSGAMYRASWFSSLNSARARRAASSSSAPPTTSSRQRSSRCCESSSTISCSRAGERRSDDKRERTCGAQSRRDAAGPDLEGVDGSGMFISCHAPDGLDKCLPGLPLLGQDTAPVGRHSVEPAAAFVGLLHPGALDPAALLQPVEQGVEGIDMKFQMAARPCLDQLAEVIAVSGTRVEQREDEQFGGPAFQLAVERARVDI